MALREKTVVASRAVWQSATWLRDALFPVFCLGCSEEGVWLCASCESARPPHPIQRCIFCSSVSPCGETCAACRKRHALAGVMVAGRYREWRWRALIRTWKYAGARDLEETIVRLMLHPDVLSLIMAATADVCIPIPLARRRERDRGFNQAEVIAEVVAEALHIPVVTALKRTRHTLAQSEVSAEERSENVAGAFGCRDEASVSGKRCLLIDDIVTTGATLEEAAKVLKAAGAIEVKAFALTRSDLID